MHEDVEALLDEIGRIPGFVVRRGEENRVVIEGDGHVFRMARTSSGRIRARRDGYPIPASFPETFNATSRARSEALRSLRLIGIPIENQTRQRTDTNQETQMTTTGNDVNAVDLILSDMAGAADDLVKEVNRRVGANPEIAEWKGQPCVKTTMEPLEVLRSLYGGIPADDTDPEVSRLRVALVGFLRRTGAYVLVNGATPEQNYWLVRHEPQPVEEGQPEAETPEPVVAEEKPRGTCPTCGKPLPEQTRGRPAIYCSRACRPSSGGKPESDQETAPEPVAEPDSNKQRRKCPQCPFVGKSAGSLQVHVSKLRGRPHPQTAYQCLDLWRSGCDVVVTSPSHLRRHLMMDHGYEGDLCHECVLWFTDEAKFAAHMVERHAGTPRQRMIARTVQPETRADMEARSEPEAPVSAGGITPEMVQAEIARILAEYPTMAAQIADLTAEVADERERRQAAERELAKIRKRLKALVGE